MSPPERFGGLFFDLSSPPEIKKSVFLSPLKKDRFLKISQHRDLTRLNITLVSCTE